MKIAVIGSRGFDDYQLLSSVLENYHIDAIVSGGAKGADSLAARYAIENNIKLVEFLPDWSIGLSAGFLRNQHIIDSSDMIIAFWDGVSGGTHDSIKKARKQKKNVVIVDITKKFNSIF